MASSSSRMAWRMSVSDGVLIWIALPSSAEAPVD
jgi:hypothetical protein